MPEFVFENVRDEAVVVAIEPWAEAHDVPGRHRLCIEHKPLGDWDVAVSVDADGGFTISLYVEPLSVSIEPLKA